MVYENVRSLSMDSLISGIMMLILFVLSISIIMMGVPQVRAIALVDVTYGSTPTVDGSISVGEYTDAHSVTFAMSGGTCTVYFKHNGSSLYVAFDVPNVDAGSAVQIFVCYTSKNGL